MRQLTLKELLKMAGKENTELIQRILTHWNIYIIEKAHKEKDFILQRIGSLDQITIRSKRQFLILLNLIRSIEK